MATTRRDRRRPAGREGRAGRVRRRQSVVGAERSPRYDPWAEPNGAQADGDGRRSAPSATGADPRELIADMRPIIDALAATDPDTVELDELHRSLEELQREADRLAAWRIRALGSYDRRRPKTKAGPSPAQGLAGSGLRQGRREGDRQVRTARKLEQLPAVQQSFDEGRISQRHADVLADTLTDDRIRDRHAAESKLLHEAERLDPDQLELKAKAMLTAADQDAAADQHRRNREQRFLRTRTDDDGSLAGSFRLDQLDGETVLTAVNALMRPDPLDAPVRRTPDQRRADALVDLARRALDADELPDLARQRPHLTAIHHHDDLDTTTAEGRGQAARRVAELANTGPAPDAIVDQLACDADTTDVPVDRHGNPLYLGRTRRYPTARLRRAVVARDRGCRLCGAPPWRCQPHHIRWWNRDRGPTDIDNLVSLCWTCHALVHDHRWTIELSPDNTAVFTDPHGRRIQRPPP